MRRCAISAHLDSVASRDCQLFFCKYGRNNVRSLPGQAYERAGIRGFRRGFLKCFNRVPTVGGCEDLYVPGVSQAEHRTPGVQLNGIVEAVFELVNEQESPTCTDEGQNQAKESIQSVTERAQWDRLWDGSSPDDGRARSGSTLPSDHGNGRDRGVNYVQCLDDVAFVVGQRDAVPQRFPGLRARSGVGTYEGAGRRVSIRGSRTNATCSAKMPADTFERKDSRQNKLTVSVGSG